MLLNVSLQFLSEFEAFVSQNLLELFGRSEGMLGNKFAISIGKCILFFPSIGEFPIKVGIFKIVNIYGFVWLFLWLSPTIELIEVKCWR